MSAKVLVLGATGMLGHVVFERLKSSSCSVVGTCRRKNTSLLFFDATQSFEDSFKSLDLLSYDAVVNCIGVLIKESNESYDLAHRVNVQLPKSLENFTEGSKTKIIHVSTDCVFSGSKGQYKVSDNADSKDTYGKTKSLGELNNGKDLTIRTSIIGPDLSVNGEGLFNWFFTLPENKQILGYSNAIWSGVSTIELADIICREIHGERTGLVQISRSNSISKFELLETFKLFNNVDVGISKHENVRVDKSLVPCSGFQISDSYLTMLEGVCRWVNERSEMYSHYTLKVLV